MTEPEPAANPQALTEEMVERILLRHLKAWLKVERQDWMVFPVAAQQDIRDCAKELITTLSRPAADRGQIVEECARVAERYNDGTGPETVRGIAAEIRALSPAPAQTEE